MYRGNMQEMVMDSIPNLEIEEAKEKADGQKWGHWRHVDNRRSYLLEFAKKMQFDPLVKSNWKGMTARIVADQV